MKRFSLIGLTVIAAIVLTFVVSCKPTQQADDLPKDSPLKPVESSKQGEYVPPGQEGPEKRNK